MRIRVDKTKAKPSPPVSLEERVRRLEMEIETLKPLLQDVERLKSLPRENY